VILELEKLALRLWRNERAMQGTGVTNVSRSYCEIGRFDD
jgi:hypothetical protein